MNIDVDEHGGGCCGINHLSYITNCSAGDIKEAISDSGMCGLLEITAVDEQLTTKVCKALKKTGFYPVSRFKNPNTDNFVTVFHKIKQKNDTNSVKDSPFFEKTK